MADEDVGGNSPMSTSEATPPHVDDSPEMVSVPSPPEEERVTSSTDHQPSEMAVSPGEPRVSSTSGQELNEGAGPSNRGQSSPDAATATENQPRPDDPPNFIIRGLLESPLQPQPSSTGRNELSLETVSDLIRVVGEASMLGAGMKLAEGDQAGPSQEITKKVSKLNTGEKSDDCNQQFYVEDLSPGSKSSENVDLESDSSPMGSGVHGEERRGSGSTATDDAVMESDSSPKIGTVIEAESSSGSGATDDPIMESDSSPRIATVIQAESRSGSGATDDAEMGSDSSSRIATVVEAESSSGSGATDDPIMESDSSPRIATVIEAESSSGCTATDDVVMDSDSFPRIGVVIEAESSSGIDAPENDSLKSELSASKTDAGIPEDVGLERELSPSKTNLAVPGIETCSTDNVGSENELSPSKTGTSGIEGSGSASLSPEKPRDNVSPKRKSPSKVDHLPPKRNVPFTSPDSLQKQRESQVSTLLEELDIEETKDKPGISKQISGQEQTSMEMEESEENQKKETEQESSMEVPETDSQKAEDEATEKDSKRDDSEKDGAE